MPLSTTRRKLLKSGLKVGLLVPFVGPSLLACNSQVQNQASTSEPSISPLNILILGGTSFLGPHQVAYALSRGHSISTFTRGKTQPTVHKELFKQVEQLVGDRANDLSALEKGNWDVVIDNSGHNVGWTQNSAELLKDRAGLYLYTSSTGVYYPYLGNDITEETELLLKEPEDIEDEEEKLEYWYGVMKANSEIAARNVFGEDRTLVVRPTYMVGPADKLDRFIHWPIRLAKGGEVLVPGRADDPVQYIDVRDVAEWMIRLAEKKISGTYNAVGPQNAQNISEFVQEAQSAFDVSSSFVSVDDYPFLKTNDIPYLVPWIPADGNNYGSARINKQKAMAAGLTFRPLKDTMKDTYDWWYSDALTEERRVKYEQNPKTVLQRESALLAEWKQYQKELKSN